MKKRYGSAVVGAFALIISASLYAQGTYTFQENIQPVLNNNCLWCHSFMESYESLLAKQTTSAPIGIPVVYPGHPDSSMIMWRLQGELPSGESITRMPQFADPLPDETIQMFSEWIAAGALNTGPVGVQEKNWGGVKLEYK